MSALRVLFLGGTGTISRACVRAAVAAGNEVTILNRGSTPETDGVRHVIGDVRSADSVRAAVGEGVDVVADFLSFVPDHVSTVLSASEGRIGQYIFISSASAYDKPPRYLPVTESTPLRNPYWQYSRDKIAVEDLLVAAHRDRGLPVTIVRPSHTYDERMLPTTGKWNDIARMRSGRPVVIHGDGTSLWTITHADDFAVAFTGLLGNPMAIGEAFTITGTHAPSRAMPGFPGAQMSVSTDSSVARAAAMACSRPPEPIRSTRTRPVYVLDRYRPTTTPCR